jgi:hypothetical protein
MSDHIGTRRAHNAGSRPAGCSPGARAGAPGRPSPPAAGRGADRPPGAPVHAADAGRRTAGSPAGRTARRRCGHPSPRSAAARHRPGRPRHGRGSRAGPRRGCHRLGPADQAAPGPGEPLGQAWRQLLRATAAALALTPVLLGLTPGAAGPDTSGGRARPGKASRHLAPAGRRREQSSVRPRVARYEDPSPEQPARAAPGARGPHDGRPGPAPPLAGTPPPGPREGARVKRRAGASIRGRC